MKIIFLGVPGNLIYNYCASVLRASGDTKRPLIFLSISGFANVFLNLFLVIVFHMGVSGVAVATIMSQYLSATLMLLYLSKQEGALRFSFKLLRFDMKKFNRILAIGIPCGIQGSLFSISNVLIQSSVNSFGAVTMAGNSAAANIEGFIYTAMNAIHHTSMNFTGQNVGARKYDRLMKVLFTCLVVVLAVWVLVGGSLLLFREPLLALYVDRNEANFSEVIAVGCERMAVVGATYFLCGILEVVTGSLRGMGKTLLPSIIQLIGACGFRIFWIYTVFKHWNSLTTLLISYPVSWILTATPLFIMCFTVKREFVRRDREADRK
jgi:putative MATE family efflux protein